MGGKSSTIAELLIVNGGKLFAQYGFDGVTTRMISEAAGLTLSAIHYYFKSKENLYLEAFRYAHDKGNRIDFLQILEENPVLAKTKKGQAEIIRTTVLRYFRNIFDPGRPSWETSLLVREIVSPSAALPALAQTFMEANVNNSEKFCKLVKPDMNSDDAAIWAHTLFSHAFLYILAKKPIAMVRGEDWLNEKLYFRAAQMISRFMIIELGLPLPEDLKQ